jgi:hypothetical protein
MAARAAAGTVTVPLVESTSHDSAPMPGEVPVIIILTFVAPRLNPIVTSLVVDTVILPVLSVTGESTFRTSDTVTSVDV